MTKTFSCQTLLGHMSADELDTLVHTHETIITVTYDDVELAIDEIHFVRESLEALGLETISVKAVCKTSRALKVFVPYGGELVS